MVRSEQMIENLMDKLTRRFGNDLFKELSRAADDPFPFSCLEWEVAQKDMEDIPASLLKSWIETWGYIVRHEFKKIDDEWVYVYTISWDRCT